jgi:hypothetical protein
MVNIAQKPLRSGVSDFAQTRVPALSMSSSLSRWRWEIYTAGKSKPVRQSEFFQTMSEATRTGKAALAELQAKRVHP